MKKLFLIAAVVLTFAAYACNSGDKSIQATEAEEIQFADDEVKVMDSSVTSVEKAIDAKESEVNELLKGI